MLHDRTPLHVKCTDKLAARRYVLDCAGAKHLLTVHDIAKTFSGLRCRVPVMVKANHDAGSTAIATDHVSWAAAGLKIRAGLARAFGLDTGEWAYAEIEPFCFTEELMTGPVYDYKFHCVNGSVRWAEAIFDAAKRGAVMDRSGAPMLLHFDHNHARWSNPVIPRNWAALVELAETLAQPFRYVRVDLFDYRGVPTFGEMTFWPKAGRLKTSDAPAFGDMLDLE